MDEVVIDWVLVCVATIMHICMKRIWFSKWLFPNFPIAECSCRPFFILSPLCKFLVDLLFSFVIAYAFALLQSLLVITSITDAMILAWIVWGAFTLPLLLDCWLNQQQKGASVFSQMVFKFVSLSVVSGIIGA